MTLGELVGPRGLIGGPFGSSLGSKDYVEEGVPVIRGTNLGFGRELGGDFVYVSANKVDTELSRNTAVPGDLIFTQRGTLGQVALVPQHRDERYVISQSQMRLRAHPKRALTDYLYFACSSPAFLRQVSDNAISTGVPHINLGILSRLTVPLPGVSEQRAIAEVLGALDDKIAANTKLIDIAKDLAVLSLARYRPTVALGNVVKQHKATVNPSLMTADEVAHFSLPAFDAGQTAEVTRPVDIKSSKFEIRQPSVLISKLNPRFPRVWNVAEVPAIPGLASTEFLVLEPSHSSTTFLWAELLQPSFGATLESKVAGTSGSHQRVRPADLLETLVVDPREVEPELQVQITSVGLLAAQSRAENESLAATRVALLPQLMSGKLRVKEAQTLVEELV